MSNNFVFVSGSDLVIPVDSIPDDPIVPEEIIIAYQMANVAFQEQTADQEVAEKKKQQPDAKNVASLSIEEPMDVNPSKEEEQLKAGSISTDKKTTDDQMRGDEETDGEKSAVENLAKEEEEKEEELLTEDAYIAFGPGGDPGRNKLLGQLDEAEEADELKNRWYGDDDSSDFSYYDDDYCDDFDDCF